MFEKRFAAVAPQLLTSDGTAQGQITVVNASLYKVKQTISLQNSVAGPKQFQVQRITNINTIFLGPVGSSNIVYERSDVSAYTVAAGSFIFAIEQPRTTVPEQEIERLTYEEEPTVARRVIMVDAMGDKYGPDNPLPIAFDGTIAVGNVTIQDDQGDELAINTDGSINVNLINSPDDPGLNFAHNEISSVPAGVETTIITLTASVSGIRVSKIDVSGENVSLFRVKVNGSTIDDKRSYWGSGFNESFVFDPVDNGLKLFVGDVLTVTTLHNRPFPCDYEATVIYI